MVLESYLVFLDPTGCAGVRSQQRTGHAMLVRFSLDCFVLIVFVQVAFEGAPRKSPVTSGGSLWREE